MGQTEIHEYLKKQRMMGNDHYFSVKEVEVAMKECGVSGNRIGVKLLKLHHWGYLEIKAKPIIPGKPWYGWNRQYRAKEVK